MTTDAAGPTIRWGVVGTGAIARAFAEDLRLLPDASLTAVGSRRRDRAQAFLNDFGGGAGQAHESVEELARNPEVDVVYIATPHTKHKDDCLTCLEGGRAVLCEKPFTVDAAEAHRRRAGPRGPTILHGGDVDALSPLNIEGA